MAASLGSYVDDLPGLSPEELERALAATETAPAPVAPTPAEMEGAAAAAAAPSAPAPPAPPAPEAALDAPIQRSAAKGFKATVRDYQDQEIADANKRLGLAERAGDETAMTHTKAAALRHEQADEARSALDTAKADAGKHKAKREEYEKRADAVYEEMAANKRPPDRAMVEKVMGVLAGLAAMGGHSSGAQGLQLIGSLFAPDRAQWAGEQAANSQLYQAATRGIDVNNASEEHDYQIASRVGAAKAHEIEAALDAVKEEGLSEEGMRAADDLKLNVRQQARGFLTKAAQDEEAARLKAAALAKSRALTRKEEFFNQVPLDELRAMPAHERGKIGNEVLAQRNKDDQAFLGGKAELEGKEQAREKGEQEIEALRQKNALGPDANLSADERKVRRLLTGVAPSVANLRKMAEAKEAPPHPYKKYVPDLLTSEETLNQQADLSAVADILLRDESGAAISPDEKAKKLDGWGVTSGDADVRRRGLNKMLAEYEARLGAHGGAAGGEGGAAKTFEVGTGGGLQRGAPAPRRAAPVDPNAPVAMITPKGARIQVRPEQVEEARRRGAKPASDFDSIGNRDRADAEVAQAAAQAAQAMQVAQAAPQTPAYADMSDEEYRAQALRDSGYAP